MDGPEVAELQPGGPAVPLLGPCRPVADAALHPGQADGDAPGFGDTDALALAVGDVAGDADEVAPALGAAVPLGAGDDEPCGVELGDGEIGEGGAVGDGVGGPSALAGDAKNQPLSARAVAAATGIRIRTVATEIASPR